jgi:hypothetical protein
MKNIDKLATGLGQWMFKVAAGVLPQVKIPVNSGVGKVMSLIGVDVSTYNIWRELGFLAEPTMQVLVTPLLNQYLGAIPDDKVKEIAMMYADAMVKRAEEKGSINLFGMEIGQDAFEDLKEILTREFEK